MSLGFSRQPATRRHPWCDLKTSINSVNKTLLFLHYVDDTPFAEDYQDITNEEVTRDLHYWVSGL